MCGNLNGFQKTMPIFLHYTLQFSVSRKILFIIHNTNFIIHHCLRTCSLDGIVTQQVKLLSTVPRFHKSASWTPGCPMSDQGPCLMACESSQEWSTRLGLCTSVCVPEFKSSCTLHHSSLLEICILGASK